MSGASPTIAVDRVPTGVDDRDLLDRLIGGSADAFTDLFARHAAMVQAVCRRALDDPSAADDAAQAAFIVLLRRPPRLPPGVPLGAWLHRTAVLCARDVARAQARRRRHERTVAHVEAVAPPERADATGARLDEALAALPAAQRDTILLRCVEGLSSAETAQRLGCAEKTVRKRLHHGLRTLRARLRSRDAVIVAALAALFTADAHAAPLAWGGAADASPLARAAAARVLRRLAVGIATPAALVVACLLTVASLGIAAARPARTTAAATAPLTARTIATREPGSAWSDATASTPPAAAPAAAPARWLTGTFQAGNPRLPIERIPWRDYTHLVHFGAAVTADGAVALNYLPPDEIARLIAARPPGKRVLVHLGDPGDASAFALATRPGVVATLVRGIVAFVDDHGYDGIDLAWLHRVDRAAYVDLIARLRRALPGRTIAVEAGNWQDLERVCADAQDDLDQIDVMCYDLDGGHGGTWHDAALRGTADPQDSTAEWRLKPFLAAGVRPEKLGIGLPFYARRWTGATLPHQAGGAIAGSLPYADLVADPTRWRESFRRWDDASHAEYLSIAPFDEFISFDGVRAMRDAAEWIRASGLGGATTFVINDEYAPDAPGEARYPLSTALHEALLGAPADVPR